MSKLTTVRGLSDSAPLQIVESVRRLQNSVQTLQESVQTMEQELQALPVAISTETSAALDPLANLRGEVLTVLEHFDTIAAAQRQCLEAMAADMGEKAARTFEQRAERLDTTLTGVKTSVTSLQKTAKQATTLPAALEAAQTQLTQEADRLTAEANKVRPRWWRQALALILAGAMAAGLLETGHYVFDRQELRDAQAELAQWHEMYRRATPDEQESLHEIARRPAP